MEAEVCRSHAAIAEQFVFKSHVLWAVFWFSSDYMIIKKTLRLINCAFFYIAIVTILVYRPIPKGHTQFKLVLDHKRVQITPQNMTKMDRRQQTHLLECHIRCLLAEERWLSVELPFNHLINYSLKSLRLCMRPFTGKPMVKAKVMNDYRHVVGWTNLDH